MWRPFQFHSKSTATATANAPHRLRKKPKTVDKKRWFEATQYLVVGVE
jgi:hypothetical protein